MTSRFELATRILIWAAVTTLLCWQWPGLHAQSSRAMVLARLGSLIGLLSLSKYTCTTWESIYWRSLVASDRVAMSAYYKRLWSRFFCKVACKYWFTSGQPYYKQTLQQYAATDPLVPSSTVVEHLPIHMKRSVFELWTVGKQARKTVISVYL